MNNNLPMHERPEHEQIQFWQDMTVLHQKKVNLLTHALLEIKGLTRTVNFHKISPTVDKALAENDLLEYPKESE